MINTLSIVFSQRIAPLKACIHALLLYYNNSDNKITIVTGLIVSTTNYISAPPSASAAAPAPTSATTSASVPGFTVQLPYIWKKKSLPSKLNR